MKKLFTFLTVALFGLSTTLVNAQTTQSQAPAQTTKAAPADGKSAPRLKKDGTPDKRFKENKGPASRTKKDGTPDKRFKENKTTTKPAPAKM